MTTEVQHIAISKPDGGVAIMLFVTKTEGVMGRFEREATDEAIASEISRSLGLKAGDALPKWRCFSTAIAYSSCMRVGIFRISYHFLISIVNIYHLIKIINFIY